MIVTRQDTHGHEQLDQVCKLMNYNNKTTAFGSLNILKSTLED